jgi:hypothetical protein
MFACRLARSLFHAVSSTADVKARVEVSYIQIYNEEVEKTLMSSFRPLPVPVLFLLWQRFCKKGQKM